MMPRIFTSANDPLNFCRKCWPTETRAFELYGNLGDGPDGRGNCYGYDEDHPSYDDGEYRCCSCRKKLTVRDNRAD